MPTDIAIEGSNIKYGRFRIELPLSPVGIIPTAKVSASSATDVSPGDSLSITIGGTTRFQGVVSEAPIRQRGDRRITAEHDAESLFSETVTLSEVNTSDLDVLRAALSAASEGGSYTIDYGGSPRALGDDYVVEDRSVLSVFRDMMDRTSRVFWVDPAGTTIHVEATGTRGLWNSLDTQQDAVGVVQFDEGSVKTVRNSVTVNGTGGEKVTATATDSTSISTYGRRAGDSPYNVSYIRSVSEAKSYASELLIPDPLASGEVVAGRSVGSVDAPQVNKTIDLTDDSKGISETGLVVEKQVIEQGRATLKVGEGSGVSLSNVNRSSKSRGDVTEPGSVYNSDRIADDAITTTKLVDTAVVESKLDDLSVALSKVQDGAISETKVQDGSISTPKLQAEAVTAAKILAGTITANEISAGTITALEIAAGTLTANEIDTLSLDTNEIEINGVDSTLVFEATQGASGDFFEIYGTGTLDTAVFGGQGRNGEAAIESNRRNDMDIILPFNGDNTGNIGESGKAYADIYAYNYIDAGTGSAINDGGDVLAGLAEGRGPPDHAAVRDDEDDEVVGYSLNGMARSAWEVVRAQQRVIEDLESRVESLESNS